jgi:hypothetical protein
MRILGSVDRAAPNRNGPAGINVPRHRHFPLRHFGAGLPQDDAALFAEERLAKPVCSELNI